MSATHKQRAGERGLVLVSTLLILSLLLVSGVGVRLMLQNDHKILANLRGSTEAFYLAEAGIAWSKDEIDRTAVHPANPANRTQNFASGLFSVSFLSTSAVSPLKARIVVRASGTAGISTQTLQSQITKSYDLADSAMGIRGNANGVALTGDPLLISGVDHDPVTGAAVEGAKSRPAISVPGEVLRGIVEAAAGNVQPPGLIEAGGAIPAVSQSDYLPPSAVSGLANDLCNAPHALSSVVPESGVLSVEGASWGTPSEPQLRCIEGLAGPGDAVILGGVVNGAGILVIKNSDLAVSGSFRWEGLVVVTGSNVSFKITGVESKEIYGAVIINETAAPASSVVTLDIQGSVKLRFSRTALGRAVALIPGSTMANSYNALPSTVTQDYWRLVTP